MRDVLGDISKTSYARQRDTSPETGAYTAWKNERQVDQELIAAGGTSLDTGGAGSSKARH